MFARNLFVWTSAFLVCLLGLLRPTDACAQPTKVYAGVYLHDVSKFDQKDGVFDVDLELWAKWLGEFEPSKLIIANAAEVERDQLGEEKDGNWHSARWRVRGTLRGEFPVQSFPFDRQTLSVVLELQDKDGHLVPDLAGSGMRERFSVTGWLYEPVFIPRVDSETYRSDLGAISGEGLPTSVRRVAFDVTLRRPPITAATKLFLPLLVILLVALVALFIHPKELEVRASVGVTALLACFAFHFAVADTMPNVAYVTLADVLFLVSYGLTAALLIESVFAYWLDSRERELAWRRLDFVSLILFPIVLVGSIWLILPATAKAHAGPIGSAREPRPTSAKKLLRVGTNSLTTPMSGLAGRAAYWGTVLTRLDDTRVPVLVEEVPSITNDSLRFLADGRLQVTWHLRPDLKWSDGTPLTADDLNFALQVSPDPRIAEALVVGTRDLVVRYHERVAAAMESITPMPRHALDAEFKRGGYEAVRAFRRTKITPSTGPYRIAEFAADDKLVLEANPFFSGAPPSISRIEIHRFADDAKLVAAFESGAIDMITPNAISPDAAQDLAKRRPEAVKIRPSDMQMFLHPDPSHPLLSQVEVRRGLAMAIDRDRIRNEVFGDSASFAHVSTIPAPGPHPEGTIVMPYDPAAARKALEGAGAVGAKLPLFFARSPVDREIAEHVAKDAAAVGLTLELTELPSTADVYRKRKHGGLVLTSTTGDRDAAPERYWSVPQVEGKYDRKYRSDAYDDAIVALVGREARALYDERREQIRNLLFVEYSKRLPAIPLLFLVDRLVAAADLDGWEEGSGNKFGRTVERWFFAPAAPTSSAKSTAPTSSAKSIAPASAAKE